MHGFGEWQRGERLAIGATFGRMPRKLDLYLSKGMEDTEAASKGNQLAYCKARYYLILEINAIKFISWVAG